MAGFYEDKIFPKILDIALRKIDPDRQRVVSQMRGKVLEIGVGTGANFSHYHSDCEVIGIEPGAAMLAHAQQRVDHLPKDDSASFTLQQASAHDLPFDDQSFDQVLVFLVLCTIPDSARAVKEAVRVLKPGGKLHYFEHVRSSDKGIANWQDRLNPLWQKLACGCHLNRNTEALLVDQGLQLEAPQRSYVSNMGPKLAGFVAQGRAVKLG